MSITRAQIARQLLAQGGVSLNDAQMMAPDGEFLAYINPKEAGILKAMGGSGRMTPMGIPSFTEDEEDTGDVSNPGGSMSGGSGGGNNGDDQEDDSGRRACACSTRLFCPNPGWYSCGFWLFCHSVATQTLRGRHRQQASSVCHGSNHHDSAGWPCD